MKNPELFHKTVGLLVKAYLNGTLEHSNCYACAVQNIVAHNMGYKIIQKPKNHELNSVSFITVIIPGIRYENTLTSSLGGNEDNLSKNQLNELISTGYSYGELTKIEAYFEGVSRSEKTTNEYIFDGLMAVVDALMQIHKANDIEAQQAKELFVLTDAG